MQRLNESRRRAVSVPLSALMYASTLLNRHPEYGLYVNWSVRQHICGHISNKPKAQIGQLQSFGDLVCLSECKSARENQNVHLHQTSVTLAHARYMHATHGITTIPKVILMA